MHAYLVPPSPRSPIPPAPLAPVVALGVREHVPRGVEVRARNGLPDWVHDLETLFGVLVPKIYDTVATDGRERAVVVEAYVVN